jgi:hypothetical protein
VAHASRAPRPLPQTLANKMKYLKVTLLILICSFAQGTCLVGMHPRVGWFPESSFDLAKESRLPEWFSLPANLDRRDVNIKIFYYVPPPPFKENVKALLIGPGPEHKIIDTKIGISRAHPMNSKDPRSPNYYPRHTIITFDGITEIVEHKKMEPIYYIADHIEKKHR